MIKQILIALIILTTTVSASELSDYDQFILHPSAWSTGRLHDLSYKILGIDNLNLLANNMEIRRTQQSTLKVNRLCAWDIATANVVCD